MAGGEGEKGSQGRRGQVGEGRVLKVTLRRVDFILGIGVGERQDKICALGFTARWVGAALGRRGGKAWEEPMGRREGPLQRWSR